MNTCSGGTRKRSMKKGGGCGCTGGRRRSHAKKTRRGGSMIGDAILAGSAVGLYSYFTKKRGGAKRLPARKTRKEYI